MAPKKKDGALDAAWSTLQSAAKKQRVVKESSIAEQVRHALADSCAWASPLEIDGIVSDEGLTLRQTLHRDKQRKANGEHIVFGVLYYRALRRVFSAQNSIEKRLDELVEEDHTPCDELVMAVAAFFHHHSNRILGAAKDSNYYYMKPPEQVKV
eukprot:3638770-Amphidinium_carterae.1